MDIEPIKFDLVREREGFSITLRGTNGEDVRLVFKQWFWLDRIIWKCLRFADSAQKPAPVKVAALKEVEAPVVPMAVPFAA